MLSLIFLYLLKVSHHINHLPMSSSCQLVRSYFIFMNMPIVVVLTTCQCAEIIYNQVIIIVANVAPSLVPWVEQRGPCDVITSL